MDKAEKILKELKIGDTTPILKKRTPLDKTNLKVITILPTVPKIFKRILFNELRF